MEDVKFVVNLDFPSSMEDYVHQIGCTARAGRTGTSYTFFTAENMKQAPELIAILTEANQIINPKLIEMARNATATSSATKTTATTTTAVSSKAATPNSVSKPNGIPVDSQAKSHSPSPARSPAPAPTRSPRPPHPNQSQTRYPMRPPIQSLRPQIPPHQFQQRPGFRMQRPPYGYGPYDGYGPNDDYGPYGPYGHFGPRPGPWY